MAVSFSSSGLLRNFHHVRGHYPIAAEEEEALGPVDASSIGHGGSRLTTSRSDRRRDADHDVRPLRVEGSSTSGGLASFKSA